MVTSLQPAVSNSSANTPLNELWRRDTYPPLLHINEWFIELSLPHTHFLAASFIPKLYLRARASLNSCLSRQNPNDLSGSDESQELAPFSDVRSNFGS